MNYEAKCEGSSVKGKYTLNKIQIIYSEKDHRKLDDDVTFTFNVSDLNEKYKTSFYAEIVAFALIEEEENGQKETEYFNFYYNPVHVTKL